MDLEGSGHGLIKALFWDLPGVSKTSKTSVRIASVLPMFFTIILIVI
jgi:hypothetical protein